MVSKQSSTATRNVNLIRTAQFGLFFVAYDKLAWTDLAFSANQWFTNITVSSSRNFIVNTSFTHLKNAANCVLWRVKGDWFGADGRRRYLRRNIGEECRSRCSILQAGYGLIIIMFWEANIVHSFGPLIRLPGRARVCDDVQMLCGTFCYWQMSSFQITSKEHSCHSTTRFVTQFFHKNHIRVLDEPAQ